MHLDRELWIKDWCMVGLVGWRRAQRVLMGFCIKVRSGNVQMFIQPTNQPGKVSTWVQIIFQMHRKYNSLITQSIISSQYCKIKCSTSSHQSLLMRQNETTHSNHCHFSWRLASLQNIFFFRVQVRIERQSYYLVVNMQLCKIDEQQFPLGGIGNWNGIWTME